MDLGLSCRSDIEAYTSVPLMCVSRSAGRSVPSQGLSSHTIKSGLVSGRTPSSRCCVRADLKPPPSPLAAPRMLPPLRLSCFGWSCCARCPSTVPPPSLVSPQWVVGTGGKEIIFFGCCCYGADGSSSPGHAADRLCSALRGSWPCGPALVAISKSVVLAAV